MVAPTGPLQEIATISENGLDTALGLGSGVDGAFLKSKRCDNFNFVESNCGNKGGMECSNCHLLQVCDFIAGVRSGQFGQPYVNHNPRCPRSFEHYFVRWLTDLNGSTVTQHARRHIGQSTKSTVDHHWGRPTSILDGSEKSAKWRSLYH